jgi:tight adherence protein B
VSWLLLTLALVVAPFGSADVHRLVAAGGVDVSLPRHRLSSVGTVGSVVRGVAMAAAALVVVAVGAEFGAAIAAAAAIALLCGTRLASRAATRRTVGMRDSRDVEAVRRLVAELDAGRQTDDALRRSGGTTSEALAHAIQVSTGSGAPLATVLRAVEADLVGEQQRRSALQVALASTRASAVVMAALPAVGLLLGSSMGTHPVEFLLKSSLGHALVLAAVLFESAGLLWTDAIAERAARG